MIDSDTQPAAEEAEKKPPHPWAELAPEHFRLLRLAPLPTDRATGARPLRFVQLGRVERHSADQSLLRLSIQVPGLMLRKEQNLLESGPIIATRKYVSVRTPGSAWNP